MIQYTFPQSTTLWLWIPNLSTVTSIYIWSEILSPKSEASFVLTAQIKTVKGLELTSNSSFNFHHLGKECAEI
jgi:hypothetical protein